MFSLLSLLFSLFCILLIVTWKEVECAEDNSRIPLVIDKLSNKIGLNLKVGNNTYLLAIDTINEGIRLFQEDTEACNKGKLTFYFTDKVENSNLGHRKGCYNPYKSLTSSWCFNANKCNIGFYPYVCEKKKDFPDPIHNSEYNSYYHTYIRTYDGVKVLEKSLEGNDVITLPWMTPELILQEFPIKVIRSNVSLGNGNNWPSFYSFDGFIGFVGSSISCRGLSIWNDVLILYNTTKYSFDLDFIDYKSSYIYLNEYPEHWNRDLILWSEPKQTGSMYDDAYSVFQIYDFKICDSFLLQEISSNWVAVFDLSSTCLSVPPFLFTRITKWLPLECPSNSDYLNNIESQNTHNSTALPYSSLCTVKETPLPIISFKLKQSGIYYMNNNGTEFDDNEYIYIHLDDYLISYNNKNYLCLLNSTQSLMGKNTYIPVDDDFSYNYYSTSLSSSNNPPILFGSLFLKSYGVTIDYSHNKIGFYQKFKYHSTKNDTYGNLNVNSNCPTKKMCIGDSTYSPSLNECIPPDCSEWFSYELDRDTNKCVVSSIYPFLISLAIIILVFFEMHVMYLKQFILDKSNSIIGSN